LPPPHEFPTHCYGTRARVSSGRQPQDLYSSPEPEITVQRQLTTPQTYTFSQNTSESTFTPTTVNNTPTTTTTTSDTHTHSFNSTPVTETTPVTPDSTTTNDSVAKIVDSSFSTDSVVMSIPDDDVRSTTPTNTSDSSSRSVTPPTTPQHTVKPVHGPLLPPNIYPTVYYPTGVSSLNHNFFPAPGAYQPRELITRERYRELIHAYFSPAVINRLLPPGRTPRYRSLVMEQTPVIPDGAILDNSPPSPDTPPARTTTTTVTATTAYDSMTPCSANPCPSTFTGARLSPFDFISQVLQLTPPRVFNSPPRRHSAMNANTSLEVEFATPQASPAVLSPATPQNTPSTSSTVIATNQFNSFDNSDIPGQLD